MSVSTNGILFYGFLIDEDDKCPWYSYNEDNPLDWGDWEEIYSKMKGFKAPDFPYEIDQQAHLDFWKTTSDLVDAEPIEIDRHCSQDYLMYYVAVKEGSFLNHRGFPTEIPSPLETKPEWIEQLKTFCTLMGITYKEPKWYLVSYWG